MTELKIRLNGKDMSIPYGTRIMDIIGHDNTPSYSNNPAAGAIVNGILVPLQEELKGNADIQTVRLISPLGKRIYRKTLCFLLSYASSVVSPERNLIIGHSLGDGYYFRYRDPDPPKTEELIRTMKAAVDADLPIDIVSLTYDEALEYSESKKLDETVKLLNTRNSPLYKAARLGNCIELYYEPVLPSAGYLTLWELREYEDGLLLRYPQSRSPYRLMEFTDNPKLFEVFRNNKRISELIGISSLGDLNQQIIDGSIDETTRLSETLLRQNIMEIGRKIKEKGYVRAVFIAGPSSSGKTTFSMKLCDELRIHGYKPLKLSLDDYYLTGDLIPLDENGEKDFDVLESLDLELFRRQLSDLTAGKSVHLAVHDFKEKSTSFREEPSQMDADTILIIEGIHGLNPHLIPRTIPEESIFRVYISALTEVNLDTRSRISTTDNRILRRMIRDNRTRGFDASETLSRFPSVERGEKNHIFPFQNNADVMINSALEYELGVLRPYAIPLLRSVGKENKEAYAQIETLERWGRSLLFQCSDEEYSLYFKRGLDKKDYDAQIKEKLLC